MRHLDRELWIAVDADEEARVRQLLHSGAESTALQDDGQPILTSARSAKVYQLLRRFGATEPPWCPRGASPLIRAAERGHASLIQLLLAEGADAYAQDSNGNTAIDRAYACNPRLAAVILARPGIIEQLPEDMLKRVLFLVARFGHVQALERFIARGALMIIPPGERRTLLAWAAGSGSAQAVTLLLNAGLPAFDDSGQGSPLHAACMKGATQCAQLLLEAGASVDARDPQGRTPLHVAIQRPEPACVELLLAAGAAVDARDQAGLTPLHLAAQSNPRAPEALRLVRQLLDAGANPRTADDAGRSLVETARCSENFAMLESLGEPAHLDSTARTVVMAVLAEHHLHYLHYLHYRPHDARAPIRIGCFQRYEEWEDELGAAEALARHRDRLIALGASWFLPLLERMAAGESFPYSHIEAAFATAHGGILPRTQPFPVSNGI